MEEKYALARLLAERMWIIKVSSTGDVNVRCLETLLYGEWQCPYENRVGGAVGFNMRTGDFHVFRAKAVIVAAGGASHIFKPRAVGEGMGRKLRKYYKRV